MMVLNENNPPLWKVTLPTSGGDVSGLPHIINPYDGEWNHQPVDNSPLVAGGTLDIVKHVPFDMNRKKRIDHATIGAFEVDSSYITEDGEFVSQTTKFSDVEEDLIVPVYEGLTITMNVPNEDFSKFFAKRIKVRATKNSSDGTEVLERFSDNILRLQRDKTGDGGPEGENAASAVNRNIFGEIPESEQYLFISNGSAFSPLSFYQTPSADNPLTSETDDFGDNEEEDDSDALNITWLLSDYSIDKFQIFGSNFQPVAGDRNKVRLTFDGGGDAALGTTLATQFHDTYKSAGGTLAIAFPNGTTFFVDKTAGGMTAHGSSLESYFYTTTPGTTVPLIGDLPVGTIRIQKPTGL